MPIPGVNTRFIVLIIILGVVFLSVISLWDIFAPQNSDQLALRVSPGDNASRIAQKLEEHGIISNSFWFRTLATLRGTDRRLIAGTYTLGGRYSLYQTLLMLEKGNTSAVRITFPEGLSLYKTLRRIADSGLADYTELYQAATDSAFVRECTGFSVSSLEGFLYPETYFFDLASTPRSILKQMTGQFAKKLESASLDPTSISNFYSSLTLASIVEKESGHPDEREIIAGVMLNRLRKGMNLASCPTVDYLLERQGIKKPVLSIADTQIQSPYNTYVVKGLPPGPICNPSLAAIQAVLEPVPTDYLFFVSNRKGRNDFSVTAEEHFRKIKKYRRAEWE